MGRSVSRPCGAVATVYLNYQFDGEEDDDDARQWAWNDFVDCVAEVVSLKYKSMDREKGWLGNEDRIILQNRHGTVTVSEYCDLVAVCLTPRDDDYRNIDLAAAWCEQVSNGFEALIEKSFPKWALRSLGHMSNGEQVFQRAKRTAAV